jgi:protein-tyrosine phosphatase
VDSATIPARDVSVIDLHCYVLPGIDDGPATLEESLGLARVAEKADLTTLVATPHVSWRYVNGPEAIREGVDAVQSAVRAAHIALDVRRGAEIAVARLGDLSDDELRALRLGDGPWLMIESPGAVDRAGRAETPAAFAELPPLGDGSVRDHPYDV